jgi:NADH:ubiquinone oxidoreductase subunit H
MEPWFTRNLSATVWNELECFLPTIIVPDILICAFAETNRTLDLAECETELIGGYGILLYENGFLFIC